MLMPRPVVDVTSRRVDVLKKKGVEAASLDSSLSLEEGLQVKNKIRDGTLKILYCAPEVCFPYPVLERLRRQLTVYLSSRRVASEQRGLHRDDQGHQGLFACGGRVALRQ